MLQCMAIPALILLPEIIDNSIQSIFKELIEGRIERSETKDIEKLIFTSEVFR